MTHDELLSKVDDLAVHNAGYGAISEALRLVLELHKPFLYEGLDQGYNQVTGLYCNECRDIGLVEYPCPTIQAIEKELG